MNSKVACIIFELKPNEEVSDIIKKINSVICDDNRIIVGNYLPTNEIVNNKKDWEERYKFIMESLGISRVFIGYQILFYIMEYLAYHPQSRGHIYMKELLDYASEKTNCKYNCCQRNLRHTIMKIYELNTEEKINAILRRAGITNQRLTNCTFVDALSQVIF